MPDTPADSTQGHVRLRVDELTGSASRVLEDVPQRDACASRVTLFVPRVTLFASHVTLHVTPYVTPPPACWAHPDRQRRSPWSSPSPSYSRRRARKSCGTSCVCEAHGRPV